MRAIVHIGFHKTGSTSIQAFLDASRDRLKECGISFFTGQHIPSNHVEMHACTMRDERMTPFKMSLDEPISSSYRSAVADRIDRFKREAGAETLLFSAEGLSYLRYDDELARLRDLIDFRTFRSLRTCASRRNGLPVILPK